MQGHVQLFDFSFDLQLFFVFQQTFGALRVRANPRNRIAEYVLVLHVLCMELIQQGSVSRDHTLRIAAEIELARMFLMIVLLSRTLATLVYIV